MPSDKFVPIAMDTFGRLAPKSIQGLKKLCRDTTGEDSKSIVCQNMKRQLMTSMSIALQKSVVSMIRTYCKRVSKQEEEKQKENPNQPHVTIQFLPGW